MEGYLADKSSRIDDATNERVLLWAQRVEAQRAEEEALNSIKQAKEIESVRCSTLKI